MFNKNTPEFQLSVQQFYYREARFLDNRQYKQWMALITEDIQYQMPSRINIPIDNRMQGSEEMIGVERELEDANSMGCPIREENFLHLAARVDRAYKMNSWSESPPARTRRIIGNIEILESDDKSVKVLSNFHLYYARPGSENFIYSGQRRDTLLRVDDSYKIQHRELIMDYSKIDVPTLGLLF